MSSNKDKRNIELLRKHKPMTKADVANTFKQQAEIKKTMTIDSSILEQNLINFNKITDPLVNPETGDALCWIRRPTASELEKLVPSELMEYRNKPEELPEDLSKKYQDFQFKMMAELIENPKHDAKWWKDHANLVLQGLFQKHIAGILEDLGIAAENF